MSVTRYCKLCGCGPREWMECEIPDCEIETEGEAELREAAAISRPNDGGERG